MGKHALLSASSSKRWLMEWVEMELKPKAVLAIKGEGEFKSGEEGFRLQVGREGPGEPETAPAGRRH